MTSRLTGVLRRGVLAAAVAAVLALLFAAPASAHAELVATTPVNGARLDGPPTEVTMTFTESVNLIDNGIRLVDSVGATLPTPEPAVSGHTITWSMPADLPDGPYVVTWRVVSTDGHPVAGAFSFGVGVPAVDVASTSTANRTVVAETAPWQVVATRWVGYLAFALVAGVVAFVLWCSSGSRTNPTLQLLARCGLVAGLVATTTGLLVQGPYTAGRPMTGLLDTGLLQATLATPFGTAMAWRLALYAALIALAWRLPVLGLRSVGVLVAAGVVSLAGTIAAAGHGASSGRLLDLGVVAVHVLTAGIWVGGLVVLVSLGGSVDRRALHQFSALALGSVLVLVATGTLNSLRHVHSLEQVWATRYGLLLLAKLALVATALVAASVSRSRLQQQRTPLRSVRVEAVLAVGVLAVTAVLSMTSPPPQDGTITAVTPAPGAKSGSSTAANALVQMSLGDTGTATLGVLPATTRGSQLHLLLTNRAGQPLPATKVALEVSNPERGLAGIPVPLTQRNGVWVASYRFPLPGVWKTTLTVDGPGPEAVVTAGEVSIAR